MTAIRAPILLIEDTPSLQLLYRAALTQGGYSVLTAGSAAEGMDLLRESSVQVVLLDLVLPDRDGLDLMQDMLTLRPDLSFVVMTAHGSINKAVEAMRRGAHEFLVKPFDETRLLNVVSNASNVSAVKRPRPKLVESAPVLPALAAPAATNSFIGSSEAMAAIQATIVSVARSMATVFITGESGTGKELCALAVHGNSPRANGPFIALNCGAIPQDLLESEVFGHMKGSFTGAISDKPGAATAADGGTLFLDEICEMAPALQTKLLRFLQTSTVVPVGATRPKKVNVRIVCATNRDPMDAVRRGQFREDLFYRLFVVPIHMPPLRERGDDVIEIAETALARFAQEEGKQFDGIAPEVRALFRRLPWPGNVRQVLNVIRNVAVLHDGGVLTTAMLPASLPQQAQDALISQRPVYHAEASPTSEPMGLDSLLGRPLAEVERMVIAATLSRHGGSVPKAARVLELSPSTLYRKIESWTKS
ncbi:MAG: sigma-54-dependent Fis family transcriptional regulator [Cypionkella sp.]|uniref:sigma-54-dependent transcriptional regulator n=1 Tax=Cypionkella sp. TaxID=2811411 RepID=UPI00260D6C91|nr:sigma-54 dependent transcriptional regulator [Cypionkella sp.]MDB5659121.1 sigma-54-dependent Fis family transcriptional regulator [Cypionkella sp.]MDB5664551.1 sigma-54-dependent Fis family transcriptional regulator [Cypionkella sp.]